MNEPRLRRPFASSLAFGVKDVLLNEVRNHGLGLDSVGTASYSMQRNTLGGVRTPRHEVVEKIDISESCGTI
jgi:hypothetical protein